MEVIKKNLHDRFDIQHTTIQFECGNCGQGLMYDDPVNEKLINM